MEQKLQLLSSSIQVDPNNPQIPQNLKHLKLEIFNELAANRQATEKHALHFCELEVTYLLISKQIENFELAIERLMKFYNQGLESRDKAHYTGIYLIYLLSFNKFAQYYSQIELLPKDTFSNPFVHFVLQLEYKLSIGSYSDLLGDYHPTGIETVFLERIMDTIRLQTALSANASYKSLTIENAIKLFNVKSIQELQQFAQKQHFKWKFDNHHVYFDNAQNLENPLNSEFLIQNSLRYVHEFDKII
ncbi:unnamed protein product (macronuclear) [Paramecium tetraurelia]|uniref:CSN8/PSMD8/EIF3K domain-containing protein n=1 Tax=Paramecium tetraurelia TaxID=5888 RepID=A0BMY4_PARTE|nr:uncharacterized protein GSPATT00030538001 [Paramecium tetraurelia]CAK59901.1 unnamed protein product [Paramecium tetraurelia]|eukprot:XP_001427299.1 hypothetical protein (macronuclear) [Paramecium tetraurelia strain d4-2]